MKKELYPVGSTVHLRGDEAVDWIIIGLVWMVDGGTVSVFMPLKAFPVGTGSVQGNTVWYLVVLVLVLVVTGQQQGIRCL